MTNKFKVFNLGIILFLVIFTSGCGVYSFTGANLNPEIQTISIQQFFNDSGDGPADLGQKFNDQIRNYFQNNTNLTMLKGNGDLQLEGSITGFRYTPIAPEASVGNTTGASRMQRLTITIKVKYINTYDETQNFERSFSFYQDYNSDQQTQSAAEPGLVNEILDQIIVDIFMAS
ncbi:LPS assembly lipoprotein LptE, partial [Xanthovirga aplysinae]|uniref:LPS assembly lipoprotein LptE n=1 Tax=Xanthovirga aplysinae TaxID=2529853 RepID=UPI0012BBD5CC